jgi:trigger factor
MMDIVSVRTKELPESRVELNCIVLPEALDLAVAAAAGEMGKGLRLPGFRKGKVPAAVIISRVGRASVIDEAIRRELPMWYSEVIAESGVEPVGEPRIEIGELPESEGESLPFIVEVGVRPNATLGDYKGLKVPREEVDVNDEKVNEEVERLREQVARLEPTEDPAKDGDTVVMNYKGSVDGDYFEGGTGTDQVVEIGSGRLIPGFEEGLLGAKKGDERNLDLTFPEDYPAEHLAGKAAVFEVEVTDVRARNLPELDDAFAEEVGYESLQAVRDDIRERMTEAEDRRIRSDFREACIDAASEKAKIEVPQDLIEARAEEIWDQTIRQLTAQGINREAYLQIAQKTEEEILKEAAPDAERSLRREATIAAIVQAEAIVPTDDQLEEALAHSAEHEGITARELLVKLREDRRAGQLEKELAARLAVDLVEESAKPSSK